jgi:hypothetical protein
MLEVLIDAMFGVRVFQQIVDISLRINWRHDISEILLKVALNTNQSIICVSIVILFSPTCALIRMRQTSYRDLSCNFPFL